MRIVSQQCEHRDTTLRSLTSNAVRYVAFSCVGAGHVASFSRKDAAVCWNIPQYGVYIYVNVHLCDTRQHKNPQDYRRYAGGAARHRNDVVSRAIFARNALCRLFPRDVDNRRCQFAANDVTGECEKQAQAGVVWLSRGRPDVCLRIMLSAKTTRLILL